MKAFNFWYPEKGGRKEENAILVFHCTFVLYWSKHWNVCVILIPLLFRYADPESLAWTHGGHNLLEQTFD